VIDQNVDSCDQFISQSATAGDQSFANERLIDRRKANSAAAQEFSRVQDVFRWRDVIITCAKQVMFSLCLFVCLSAGLRKKTTTQPNITKLLERWHIEEN